MTLELIGVSSADMEWLGQRCDLPHAIERVAAGVAGAFRVGGADAALVLSVGTAIDTGVTALWIECLGGSVGWKPKSNQTLIAAVFDDCTSLARASGCSEIRIEANNRSGLKLRLFRNYGFEAVSFGAAMYMRKAL